MTFGYKNHYSLIQYVKEIFPKVPIIVGGPHVSTLREQVLEDCAAIDYGAVLEGEETIVELCKGVPLMGVKGLIFREDKGQIMYTGDRPFLKDLDAIEFPKYTSFELNKYPRPLYIPIVSSRGCPYNCIYCPVHLAMGRRFRVRRAVSVVDEIQYWYEKGSRHFGIADDNFSLIKSRIYEICDEIERRQLSDLKITCGNGLRADKVDRELLTRMREVGFSSIAFGVEAGNNRILKKLRKSERIEDIELAIRNACELDYQVTLFFLLGSPGETVVDVKDSVPLATKYPVYDVRFYNLIPFPKTELYDWVKENNYFVKSTDYLNTVSHWVNEPIFQTPEMSTVERKRLYEWANKVTQRHCLKIKKRFHQKDVANKFHNLGLALTVSNILSCLYWSQPFQLYFKDADVVRHARRCLFRKC